MRTIDLYEMQVELDERIIKEKGLEGQDLISNTVLALQVEIGECGNEWRYFKDWSNDRLPRRAKMLVEFVDCLHFILSLARQLHEIVSQPSKGGETWDEIRVGQKMRLII